MNWQYYKFLSIGLLKRKSVVIVGFLYLLFIFIFLILVPSITNIDPLYIWSNSLVSPTTILMYVGALFSSISSIFIFKQYRDDGTELIISSKPLTRKAMIITKFVLYISFCLAFNLVASMIGWITLSFPFVSVYQAFSLSISILLANLVICLILGFISTFVSLYLNRVWTILINIISIVICAIYSICNMLVTTTAATYLENQDNGIGTISYVTRNNQYKNAAFMSPKITTQTDENGNITNITISPITLDGAQDIWNKANDSHPTKLNNFFDFNHQFQLMNNLFGAQDYIKHSSSEYFGSDTWFDYGFDTANRIPDERTGDDRPLYAIGSLGSLPKKVGNITDMFSFLQFFLENENIVFLGSYHAPISVTKKFNWNSALYEDMIGQVINGTYGMKNSFQKFKFDDERLVTNPQEEELFNRILEGYKDNGLYKPGLLYKDEDHAPNLDIIETQPSLDPQYIHKKIGKFNIPNGYVVGGEDHLEKITNQWEWLHYVMLKDGYFENNPKQILGIDLHENDPYHYALSCLKFYLYSFEYYVKEINALFDNEGATKFPSPDKCYMNEEWRNITDSPIFDNDVLKNIKQIKSCPLLPISLDGDLSNITDTTKWESPFFYNGISWNSSAPEQKKAAVLKAMFSYITTGNNFGFTQTLHTNDLKFHNRYEGQYSNKLITSDINFVLGYNTLLSNYTVSQKIDFWQLTIFWSIISAFVGMIVIFIYWKVDFK